jgi:hypothetical protein
MWSASFLFQLFSLFLYPNSTAMKIINRNILVAAGFATALTALPWGQKGHDTVAYIAECHLTPEAKAAAEELLDGKSIVYYANWMDNASHTPEYAYTKTWHYKNIDADETFAEAKLNDKGDIVTALNEQILVLGDTTKSKEERALALKMVVHFLGDMHQPMHLGRLSDLGGNRHEVRYFKNPTNLHTVWDSRLVESAHKWSYTEWQQQIDRATPEEEAAILSLTTPAEWAEQTYGICREVYEKTPADMNIEYTYIADWTPVIEQQFLRGGLRLAKVLNDVLAPAVKK